MDLKNVRIEFFKYGKMIVKSLVLLVVAFADANKSFNTSLLDGKVKMPAAPVNENTLFVVALKLNNKLFCTGSLVSIKDVLSTSSCCTSTETHLNDKKKVVIAVFNNIIARIDAVFRVNRDSETRYKLGYIKILPDLNISIEDVKRCIISIADQAINLVGETVSVMVLSPAHHRYIVRRMQVKIEDNTICDNTFRNTKVVFIKEDNMCGSPLNSNHQLEKEDSGAAVLYGNVLVGVAIFRKELGAKVPHPPTFLKLENLRDKLPGMEMNTVRSDHPIYRNVVPGCG